jgi:digeranylgeranylglycerophospholipid reductase
MKAGIIAGDVAAKVLSNENLSKDGLKSTRNAGEDIGKHIARGYKYKKIFLKLTDNNLNQLIGSLKNEDISNMDLHGMLRMLFKLNPRLPWNLRHLAV